MKKFALLLFILTSWHTLKAQPSDPPLYKATFIQELTWMQAREVLNENTIVVIPLGADSKEHGPHLLLKNDRLLANYFTDRLAREEEIVIYPTIGYHFYPSFVEYAGSTTLRFETSYQTIIDLCQLIASHGPKKIYILNTGVSTLRPLKVAAEKLAAQGILLTYTDIIHIAEDEEKKIKEQPMGTHADEIETSMMLYIAPQTVDMLKAARDIPEKNVPGSLSLDPKSERYSPTGIFGDATLANVKKGEIVVEATVRGMIKEVQQLRMAELPPVTLVIKPSLYSGPYAINANQKILISEENGNLYFQMNNDRSTKLIPESENAFYIGQIGRIVFPETKRETPTIVILTYQEPIILQLNLPTNL